MPASGPETPARPSWASAVALREDPQLTAELTERLARGSGVRGVGVTDLLALRPAFWRRVAPPPAIGPERRERMESGRALHRWLATLFAGRGRLEVRVRRDGLAGRIDVLADVPIEVKTGATLPRPEELRSARPDHLEQLGMYCALTEVSVGRLVLWALADPARPEVRCLDVEFRDLAAIHAEMRERAAALRRAWAAGRPDELPRCPWFGRGCEFQENRRCGCTGAEPVRPGAILPTIGGWTLRPDLDAEFRARWSERGPPASGPGVERFRDLLYPRRAYFESVAPPAEPTGAPRPAAVDLFARLTEAVESGPIGEVAGLPARADEPREEVAGFRDAPYLVRTSRAGDRTALDRWVDRYPQYALELGFRCAVTGGTTGRLVLGYDRAESDRERIRVIVYEFRPLTPFARLCRTRVEGLRAARRRSAPETLEPCPRWMWAECPFRSRCGCDGTGPPAP